MYAHITSTLNPALFWMFLKKFFFSQSKKPNYKCEHPRSNYAPNFACHYLKHLNDDPLVRLLFQNAVCRIGLDLLSNGWGDGRDEGERIEVQVITQDLSKHLWSHKLLWRQWKQNQLINDSSTEQQKKIINIHQYSIVR